MKTYKLYPAIVSAMLLAGCNDTWNDHYTDAPENISDATVLQQLKADPELSDFVSLIETAGYDELLNSSQTFTVWAPVNGTLDNVGTTDKAAAIRTVMNHIARFSIPSSTGGNNGVKMLNGKLLYFSDGADAFGGVRLLGSDIRTGNGLVHKLESVVPYTYNLREYIDNHDSTSKLSAFFARFDEKLPASKVPGAPTSASDVEIVDFNRLFQYPDLGLGDIASEDSVFTMAIPDDEAWQAAYNSIKPYFVTYNADQAVADSIQDVQTSLAIVDNLVFRTRSGNPLTADSLITTTGSIIHSPSDYFKGMSEIPSSNGRMFLAPALNYNMKETFNKPIEIEAEEQGGRKTGANTDIRTRSVSTDSPFASLISSQRYIYVSSSTISRQPSVTFTVPDVLAGEYDIYASFVPACVEDGTNTGESTRVQFTLAYLGANGKNQTKTFNDKTFIVAPDKMTLIQVAKAFKFPVANYYDHLWYMNTANDPNTREITTSILVQTNVSNAELNRNELVRRFRIDRLYLVPVDKTNAAL